MQALFCSWYIVLLRPRAGSPRFHSEKCAAHTIFPASVLGPGAPEKFYLIVTVYSGCGCSPRLVITYCVICSLLVTNTAIAYSRPSSCCSDVQRGGDMVSGNCKDPNYHI